MNNDIDKLLQEEFALKKTNAEERAQANLNLALKNDIFQKLDKLEREVSFSLGEEKAKGNNKAKVKELSLALEQIKNLKETELIKMGLTSLDLKPQYSCSKCNDTGIYNGYRCSCYKKRKNEEIIKLFSPDLNTFCDFDSIDVSIIQDENHLKDYVKLKNLLQKWCDNYPNNKKFNILISGATGLGKTFLAKCMAQRLLSRDFSVSFLSAFKMNSLMLTYHTTFDNKKEDSLVPLLECDALFIDDLGSEQLINNVTINYLYNILSEREAQKKSTIITTNLSENNIKARYGERIFSRLVNKKIGAVLKISGSDLRIPNLNRKE